MKKTNISKCLRTLMLILTIASLIFGVYKVADLCKEITAKERITLAEDGIYNSKEDIADYIYKYGHLPSNYLTKDEAQVYGWIGGNPETVKEKAAIGGNRFYDSEGEGIPLASGRYYYECDVNSWGLEERNGERILFSNDGMIIYTGDHYQTFEILYKP